MTTRDDHTDPDRDEQEGDSDKEERPSEAAIGSNYEEKRLGEMRDAAILRRLAGFMKPYWPTFLVSLLLLPVISGLQLVQPHLIQIAIDSYLVPGELSGLHLVIIGFGAAVGLRGAFKFLQFYLMQRAGQNALVDLRNRLFGHVQDRPIDFFHDRPTGRLMTRMTTDVESLQRALSSGMITMLGDLITLVGIVGILLYKSWRLALVSFAVLPFLIALTAVFRHYLRKAYREVRTRIARLYAHLQESISGMDVIQLFVREGVSAEEYEDINTEYRNANFRSIRYDAMLYAVVEAVGSITVGCIIWYGSGRVLEGIITLGVLVAFIEYMQKFFVPIRNLAEKYNQLQSAIASAERIFMLLDNDERLPERDDTEPVPEPPLRIEFEDVWFAYDEDEWILRDVSFEITPGERIAVVGHTGAGKTTIFKLLLRLYDVDRGHIRVDGTDIREFDLSEYRRQFAAVLQDDFLFEGTLRENLDLSDDGVDDEQLVEALDTVCGRQLVDEHPDGLERRVEERGANFSSGEKQILSFARSLVRSPEVLLLDEATANVDTETEQRIQRAVENLLEQQTSLVIAHRLSTIESADRILVLHKGEIVERGEHGELVARGGHYAKLHELQYASHTPTARAGE